MNRASFFKQLIIILDVTKSNGFLLPLASSYEDLAGRLQLALYRHNNSGGEPIYEADEMEQFAQTCTSTVYTTAEFNYQQEQCSEQGKARAAKKKNNRSVA